MDVSVGGGTTTIVLCDWYNHLPDRPLIKLKKRSVNVEADV